MVNDIKGFRFIYNSVIFWIILEFLLIYPVLENVIPLIIIPWKNVLFLKIK